MPNYQDTNPKTKAYLGNGTSELSPECLKGMIKLMGMGALIKLTEFLLKLHKDDDDTMVDRQGLLA